MLFSSTFGAVETVAGTLQIPRDSSEFLAIAVLRNVVAHLRTFEDIFRDLKISGVRSSDHVRTRLTALYTDIQNQCRRLPNLFSFLDLALPFGLSFYFMSKNFF